MAVDLIQSEYGWTDEVVLEMPICTIRQKVANIEFRLKAQRTRKNTITEWQTRTIAQFIAATVPVEKKGAVNKLAEEASAIRLRIENDEHEADTDRPYDEIFEMGSQTNNNKPGSYEHLMSRF